MSAFVWLQDDALSPENPALQASPGASPVFLFDEAALRAEPLAFHRLFFAYECAAELGGRVFRGEVLAIFQALGATRIATTFVPGGRFAERIAALRGAGIAVDVHEVPQLVDYDAARVPLRFSRWWREVEAEALGQG